MKRTLLCIVVAALANSAEWRMAKAPLMTEWSERVDPRNPLPEYPRPLMERADWLNLNGIWQFEEAEAGDSGPFGRNLRESILVPFLIGDN